jgi:hypothetical protein
VVVVVVDDLDGDGNVEVDARSSTVAAKFMSPFMSTWSTTTTSRSTPMRHFGTETS